MIASRAPYNNLALCTHTIGCLHGFVSRHTAKYKLNETERKRTHAHTILLYTLTVEKSLPLRYGAIYSTQSIPLAAPQMKHARTSYYKYNIQSRAHISTYVYAYEYIQSQVLLYIYLFVMNNTFTHINRLQFTLQHTHISSTKFLYVFAMHRLARIHIENSIGLESNTEWIPIYKAFSSNCTHTLT